MPDPTSAYAEAVLAGQIVAGPLVRLACERHRRDREDGPSRGLRWDPAAAARPINFIERALRLPESAEPPAPPWAEIRGRGLSLWLADRGRQPAIPLGVRGVRQGERQDARRGGADVVRVPRGRRACGRVLQRGAEPGSESRICFRDASRMVQASPALRRSVEILEQALFHPASGSVVKPLSAEARTLDGRRGALRGGG